MNRIARAAATALVALGLTVGLLPGAGGATINSPGSSGCCKVAL